MAHACRVWPKLRRREGPCWIGSTNCLSEGTLKIASFARLPSEDEEVWNPTGPESNVTDIWAAATGRRSQQQLQSSLATRQLCKRLSSREHGLWLNCTRELHLSALSAPRLPECLAGHTEPTDVSKTASAWHVPSTKHRKPCHCRQCICTDEDAALLECERSTESTWTWQCSVHACSGNMHLHAQKGKRRCDAGVMSTPACQRTWLHESS